MSWRHQTIDIPEIKPHITEYRLYAGICQGGGKPHEASLPLGVSAKLMGSRLLALIGTLTGGYRLSKRLVQGLLQDVFRISALQQGINCEESKTANTCKRLLKVKTALWTFVYTQGVEPTNNLAERTIRTYVIWRKTSFGTPSKRGSLYMERMMTVVGSCKLQGRNVLAFVTEAIGARMTNAPAPSLLPARVG